MGPVGRHFRLTAEDWEWVIKLWCGVEGLVPTLSPRVTISSLAPSLPKDVKTAGCVGQGGCCCKRKIAHTQRPTKPRQDRPLTASACFIAKWIEMAIKLVFATYVLCVRVDSLFPWLSVHADKIRFPFIWSWSINFPLSDELSVLMVAGISQCSHTWLRGDLMPQELWHFPHRFAHIKEETYGIGFVTTRTTKKPYCMPSLYRQNEWKYLLWKLTVKSFIHQRPLPARRY